LRAVRPACAAAAAFLLAAPVPAFAFGPQPSLTAEQAIEVQRDTVREAVGTAPCSRGRDRGDIVVCGRRGPDPNRPPLPFEPLDGDREHLLPGELPRAKASYDTCAIACPRGSGIDVFKAVDTSVKIVRHILGKDD
jgi:hypothetical protein